MLTPYQDLVLVSGDPSLTPPLGQSTSLHLARPLGWGSLVLCLSGMGPKNPSVLVQYLHDGWCEPDSLQRNMGGGASGTPATQVFLISSFSFLSHITLEMLRDWAASGQSGSGCNAWALILPFSVWLLMLVPVPSSASVPAVTWKSQGPFFGVQLLSVWKKKKLISELQVEYSWARYVSNYYFLLGSFEPSPHSVLSFYSWLLLNNCFIIYLPSSSWRFDMFINS